MRIPSNTTSISPQAAAQAYAAAGSSVIGRIQPQAPNPTAIPVAKTPNYHPDSASVVTAVAPTDAGGWLYDNVLGDFNLGRVMVNCTHTDTKGTIWTSY